MEESPFYQVCLPLKSRVILPPDYVDAFVRGQITANDDAVVIRIIRYVKTVNYIHVNNNKLYFVIHGTLPRARLSGMVAPGVFNSAMTKKFSHGTPSRINSLSNLIVNRTGQPIYLPRVHIYDSILMVQQNSDNTKNVLKYKKIHYVGEIHNTQIIQVCDIIVINGWLYQRTHINDIMNCAMQFVLASVYIINGEVHSYNKLNIRTVLTLPTEYIVNVYDHIIFTSI